MWYVQDTTRRSCTLRPAPAISVPAPTSTTRLAFPASCRRLGLECTLVKINAGLHEARQVLICAALVSEPRESVGSWSKRKMRGGRREREIPPAAAERGRECREFVVRRQSVSSCFHLLPLRQHVQQLLLSLVHLQRTPLQSLEERGQRRPSRTVWRSRLMPATRPGEGDTHGADVRGGGQSRLKAARKGTVKCAASKAAMPVSRAVQHRIQLLPFEKKPLE